VACRQHRLIYLITFLEITSSFFLIIMSQGGTRYTVSGVQATEINLYDNILRNDFIFFFNYYGDLHQAVI